MDKFCFSDLAQSGVHYQHQLLRNRPIAQIGHQRATDSSSGSSSSN